MRWMTETSEKKQNILIVAKDNQKIIKCLKEELQKYQTEIFISPVLPNKLDLFDYCFFINDLQFINQTDRYSYKNAILIFVNQKHTTERIAKIIQNNKLKNIKAINISGGDLSQAETDKILWFSFSRNSEIYLSLKIYHYKSDKNPSKITKVNHSFDFQSFIIKNKKKLIYLTIACIFFSQLIFIPALFFSSYSFYKSSLSLKKEDINGVKQNLFWGNLFFDLTKTLYAFSRPSLSFFSLTKLFDNTLEINNRAHLVIKQTLEIRENMREFSKLILTKNKSEDEALDTRMRFDKIKAQLNSLLEDIKFLQAKLPSNKAYLKAYVKELGQLKEILEKTTKIIAKLDLILGQKEEKKYLLLFANNAELRPGGGFIGSFGIVTFKKFTLDNLQVYDVYDADGQLKAHIDPPESIRRYLNQPHWFLRDSAYSPDFLDNYIQAKFFLEKEMKISDFAGAFLITTTALQNILKAYGDIYLTDYQETINSDNFYIKTQLYSEQGFFPGSTQKKTFLSSLSKHLLINIDKISLTAFAGNIKKSLDEKHIVVFFEEEKIQKFFDAFSWSGRVAHLNCVTEKQNCLLDYLYPYDANLGVNKANLSLNKLVNLKIKIKSDGSVNHVLSLKYINSSSNAVFPGGNYKNYFQILLPKNSRIKRITKNGVIVENYDEEMTAKMKTVGFLFETKPKSSSDIKLEYELADRLAQGKSIYQLTFQKQIGGFNDDFVLELQLAQNISVLNQNISSLVKNSSIVYNTNLSTDKIFLFELIKE